MDFILGSYKDQVYAYSGNNVYVSKNGANWVKTNLPNGWNYTMKSAGGKLYATNNKGLFVATGAAGNFEQLAAGNIMVNTLEVHGEEIYAAVEVAGSYSLSKLVGSNWMAVGAEANFTVYEMVAFTPTGGIYGIGDTPSDEDHVNLMYSDKGGVFKPVAGAKISKSDFGGGEIGITVDKAGDVLVITTNSISRLSAADGKFTTMTNQTGNEFHMAHISKADGKLYVMNGITAIYVYDKKSNSVSLTNYKSLPL